MDSPLFVANETLLPLVGLYISFTWLLGSSIDPLARSTDADITFDASYGEHEADTREERLEFHQTRRFDVSWV